MNKKEEIRILKRIKQIESYWKGMYHMYNAINQKIKELYESNRSLFTGKPVAFDGIVDEESYHNSKIKTAYLLKEVNVKNAIEDWDFISWLRTQAEGKDENGEESLLYKTWPNVCMWNAVLNNSQLNYQDCMQDGYYNFDSKQLRKELNNIAVVNIKKVPG